MQGDVGPENDFADTHQAKPLHQCLEKEMAMHMRDNRQDSA